MDKPTYICAQCAIFWTVTAVMLVLYVQARDKVAERPT